MTHSDADRPSGPARASRGTGRVWRNVGIQIAYGIYAGLALASVRAILRRLIRHDERADRKRGPVQLARRTRRRTTRRTLERRRILPSWSSAPLFLFGLL